jgi:hypothetical protein
MKQTLLIFFLFTNTGKLFAQQDIFPGTWEMRTNARSDSSEIYMQLQVAKAGNDLLYPAQLKIVSGSFSGTYQLLLVKKNERQLAIGRHKFPISEKPFSLGTWTILLNGTFDLETNTGGQPVLTANRIPAKRYGFTMPLLTAFADSNRNTAIEINKLLKEEKIPLKKINQDPWRSIAGQNMLHSQTAPAYFGIVDTFYTNTASAFIRFAENNKADNDTVSVWLNGRMIMDHVDINYAPEIPELKLDTGLNILVFFADNYGRVPPNTAKLNTRLAERNYLLDFTTKENMSATFIVSKIYYYPDGKKKNADVIARKEITDKIRLRETKQIDSIKAFSEEITLALWDDAVEDGDSISLQINDEIFMPGIAVKKRPQFIQVKLYPGDNKIIFIADNLGAISPNTSVLEIIDGKRRKSYMINTNLGENNSIKIVYNSSQ